MNMNRYAKVFIGSELKLNIHIDPIGNLTMDDYDWEAELYCCPNKKVVVKKEESIRIDGSDYVILVDTKGTGAGDLKCRVTAYIPDEDFNDGFRTEVVSVLTGINIIKQI